MEDGISERAYLIAAVFALVDLLAADAVVFWVYYTALRAGGHSAVALLEHVVQTCIVARKLLVKLFDRVFHLLTVYYRGYMMSRDSYLLEITRTSGLTVGVRGIVREVIFTIRLAILL